MEGLHTEMALWVTHGDLREGSDWTRALIDVGIVTTDVLILHGHGIIQRMCFNLHILELGPRVTNFLNQKENLPSSEGVLLPHRRLLHRRRKRKRRRKRRRKLQYCVVWVKE